MMILRLAYESLRSRKFTTGLTVFSIALSVLLLVGVDRIRQGTETGFEGTLSQTDLVVGARGGSLPLLLYAVFHIGTANNEISWNSYQHFAHHPAVLWTIPLSMGDSHRGFRVVATDDNFYEHYRYRGDHSLQVSQGVRTQGIFDAVLGSAVAAQLHYHLGQKIILSHGLQGSFLNHAADPYTVVGILARTATPVDRAIYITLWGDEAMHLGWENGAPPLQPIPESQIRKSDLQIRTISAFLLRTKWRIGTLFLQREINTYKPEPLTAIIPAMTLEDLWSVLGAADIALSLVSGAVLVVGLLVMLTALYTALNERRREIAVLRSLGLHARQIFMLFILESALISGAGAMLGVVGAYAVLYAVRIPVENRYGIPLAMVGVSSRVAYYMIAAVVAGALLGFIPAIRAYRNALVDGLSAD
ncbi:MAG: putative transport system permease protein [Acidobacteriaceae bacterium]|jgi:putative ABC transport system permease protein|nr:putative transport system permease protein [Acidobacteriaceae bacterium]